MNQENKKEIPTFAVVGKVNMGKTSVLSTLLEQDDNSILRVSPTPGETTHCQAHSLTVGEEELIKFIDTPGFSRPVDTMREIRQFHGDNQGSPGRAAIKHFVTHYKGTGEFVDEILLLEPLLEGVGIIYVIDTSRPIRDSYIAEMEILRWTGCQRLAVINNQQEPELGSEWKIKLGSFFNLVRTFNAHKATYGERIKLLRSLLEIDEAKGLQIQQTIDAIEQQWIGRREASAELIMELVQTCLMHEESVSVSRRDCENEQRKEKEIEALKITYFKSITELQHKCFNRLRDLYKHHRIEAESSDDRFAGIDLEAEETWTKWGLNRNQLAIAGGLTGATAGGAIDIGTAGATHGLGAVIGGLVGMTTTYFKGGSLPNFSITLEDLAGIGSSNKDNEQRKLKIDSPQSENYPWILLDTMLFKYHAILLRSHGRRDQQKVEVVLPEESLVRKMTTSQRSMLTQWFVSCKKGKPDYALEPKVLEVLEEALSEAD